MRSRARLPLSLFITVSTLLCAGSQFAAAQTLSLRYAQSYSAIRSIFSLPVTVAERAGFFRREKLDFLQINYSILEREAEERILPLAQERGVAVLINRPLGGGDLFARVRAKPLPDWAAEFECKTWAQFLLKWIVAHPAVTCAIPATGNARHLEDNMQAGMGRLPDSKARERMVQLVEAI